MRHESLSRRYWRFLTDPLFCGPLPRQGLSLWQRYWVLLTAADAADASSAVRFRVPESGASNQAALLDSVGRRSFATSVMVASAEPDILMWPDRRGLVQRLIPLAVVAAVVMLLGIAVGSRSAPVPAAVATAPQLSPYAILPDPKSGGVASIAFNAAGTMFATADLNGHVYLWNAATDRMVRTLYWASSRGTVAVAFSPDGKLLAVGDRNGLTYLLDMPSGQLRAVLPCAGDAAVNAVAFSADGNFLAAGSASSRRQVCVWSVSSLARVSMISGDGSGITAVAFSPDLTTLAVAEESGVVNLWQHQLAGTLRTPARARANSVAFSPDSQFLAVGGSDGATRLWDLATRTLTGTLTVHAESGSITSVAFSQSGTVLASASQDGSVYLWNVVTHHLIVGVSDPGSAGVNAVTFSPARQDFATADQNGLIYLWTYSPVPSSSRKTPAVATGPAGGIHGKFYTELTYNHLGTSVFRDPMGDAVTSGPASIPYDTQVEVKCWTPNESDMASINVFYLVETPPWTGEYAPANTFLNADTSGSLDPHVPACPGG